MSTQRLIRERQSIFQNIGINVEAVERTAGAHIKFRVEYLGKKRIFVCPSTSSDCRRGIKNFKGDVTKWIKEIANEK